MSRKSENRSLRFLSQHIYPTMFIQMDEGEYVSAGKTTAVFLLLPRSVLSLTGNGITHQRNCFFYPILLWPPPAFVHIHHNNSPDPNLQHQPSPCLLFLSGERLNLDQNEKFIYTLLLIAILIRYDYSATFRLVSLLFFSVFITQLFFKRPLHSLCPPYHPAVGNSQSKRALWVTTLFKVELQSTITAFRALLKYVWVISDETFAEKKKKKKDVGESALSVAR